MNYFTVPAFLLALFCQLISVTQCALAQTSAPIGASSSLLCIFQPNGKTTIAKKTAKGSRATSFKRETAAAKKAKDKAADKLKDLNKVIRSLEAALASPEVWLGFSKKELNLLRPFIRSGEFTPGMASPQANLEALLLIRENLLTTIAAAKNLISRIKSCKKKKMPNEGEFPVIFKVIKLSNDSEARDNPGSAIVGVFAQIPWTYALTGQNLFCFQRPAGQSGGAIPQFLSGNPCFHHTLSNFQGACDDVIEFNAKGEITVGVGYLAKGAFSYKNFREGQTLTQRAGAMEATLRSSGWTDGVKFVVRKGVSADNCKGVEF
jgi:hypothetical protein